MKPKNASEANTHIELFRWSGVYLAPRSKGRTEN